MSDAPVYSVQVNVGGFSEAPQTVMHRAVRMTLEREGVPGGEISVTLLGDEAMRQLNRSYLAKDRPTDVISFSLGDAELPVGDIYIGVPQARRQAEELGVDLTEELVRLAVHGTLHALGWNHPEGPERVDSPMFRRQEELVRSVWAELAGSRDG